MTAVECVVSFGPDAGSANAWSMGGELLNYTFAGVVAVAGAVTAGVATAGAAIVSVAGVTVGSFLVSIG